MHRMLVMCVSFVKQIENGTPIYSPLNNENIMVFCRCKKKNPSTVTIKVEASLNVDIVTEKHLLPSLCYVA